MEPTKPPAPPLEDRSLAAFGFVLVAFGVLVGLLGGLALFVVLMTGPGYLGGASLSSEELAAGYARQARSALFCGGLLATGITMFVVGLWIGLRKAPRKST